jgi:hypothetical protein
MSLKYYLLRRGTDITQPLGQQVVRSGAAAAGADVEGADGEAKKPSKVKITATDSMILR